MLWLLGFDCDSAQIFLVFDDLDTLVEYSSIWVCQIFSWLGWGCEWLESEVKYHSVFHIKGTCCHSDLSVDFTWTRWPVECLIIFPPMKLFFLSHLFIYACVYAYNRVSCSLPWSRTCDITDDELELLILQLPPPKCWDCRCLLAWLGGSGDPAQLCMAIR